MKINHSFQINSLKLKNDFPSNFLEVKIKNDHKSFFIFIDIYNK